jgi:hypothetical protein
VGIDEKSGQLIECANPEHWKLGSIHYIQPECVGKSLSVNIVRQYEVPSNPALLAIDLAIADSDESWQASEALLRK